MVKIKITLEIIDNIDENLLHGYYINEEQGFYEKWALVEEQLPEFNIGWIVLKQKIMNYLKEYKCISKSDIIELEEIWDERRTDFEKVLFEDKKED